MRERVLGGFTSVGRRASMGALLLLGAALAPSACGEGAPFDQSRFAFGDGGAPPAIEEGGGGAGGDDDFEIDAGLGGSDDGGFDPDAACAASVSKGEVVPVNMLIMFDRSGSMADEDKWLDATTALSSFFTDPSSAGLRVALRFFPDAGCDGQSCNVGVCAQPMVPLGELTAEGAPADAQEAQLLAALQSKWPDGGTPMSAALGGAEVWAIDHQSKSPGEKTVVVLVTDGEPNGCEEDINKIAQLAADANAASGVLTYTVGLMGSEPDQMNTIAAAGGTAQSFFIGGGDVTAELIAALEAIQGSSVGCEFAMPQSTGGEKIDPSLVNVSYAPGDGSPKIAFGQAAGLDLCPPEGGWYYDDPVKPQSILLCPASCAEVQADPGAQIEILLGCATTPVK